ncbi:hypothetical protein [uncultured phage MedDCM-OCT-S05-C113]|nr:hypothetical protein [uncultured phage MedDCM-OCT-S05-C113]
MTDHEAIKIIENVLREVHQKNGEEKEFSLRGKTKNEKAWRKVMWLLKVFYDCGVIK